MSQDTGFPCRDCGIRFPTAKLFVEHIDGCEPSYADGFDPEGKPGLFLQNAAIFLRTWVKTGQRALHEMPESEPPSAADIRKLIKDTKAWLKQHNLQ